MSEHVYCVVVTFKVTEEVEQRLCIKFCVKFEHSSVENYLDDSEGHNSGQLVIGDFITTTYPLMHLISSTEFTGKTSNHPGDSAPLQLRFGVLRLLAFSKTKITFEREEISDLQ